MSNTKRYCRVDKRTLDDVCLDCQYFLNSVLVECENCPVERLKDRIGK